MFAYYSTHSTINSGIDINVPVIIILFNARLNSFFRAVFCRVLSNSSTTNAFWPWPPYIPPRSVMSGMSIPIDSRLFTRPSTRTLLQQSTKCRVPTNRIALGAAVALVAVLPIVIVALQLFSTPPTCRCTYVLLHGKLLVGGWPTPAVLLVNWSAPY